MLRQPAVKISVKTILSRYQMLTAIHWTRTAPAAQHAAIIKRLRAATIRKCLKDAAAFADRFTLPPDQRDALIKLDLPSIVKMGAHPLVPFPAQLQMKQHRPQG